MPMLTRRQCIGLEADLNLYHELKFDHGTDTFLEIPNQNILRTDELARFLARAKLDRSRNAALYDYVVEGKDLVSSSRSLREASLPAREHEAFREAILRLQDKARDQAAPKSAAIIEAFRLPSPGVDPDLYRLVGSFRDPRLVVLWGCETEPGASLEPLEAVEQLRAHIKPAWRVGAERAALVLLLLGLLLLLWHATRGSGEPDEMNQIALDTSSAPEQTPEPTPSPRPDSNPKPAPPQETPGEFDPRPTPPQPPGTIEPTQPQPRPRSPIDPGPAQTPELAPKPEPSGPTYPLPSSSTRIMPPIAAHPVNVMSPSPQPGQHPDIRGGQPPQGRPVHPRGSIPKRPDESGTNPANPAANHPHSPGGGENDRSTAKRGENSIEDRPESKKDGGSNPGTNDEPRRTTARDRLVIVSEPSRSKDQRSVVLNARLKSSTDAPLRVESWTIDGREVPSQSRQLEVPLDPGSHTIEVRATSGAANYRAKVMLRVETTYKITSDPEEGL